MASAFRSGPRRPWAKIQLWELELARKVAAAFRTPDHNELVAELARRLLDLKAKRPEGIRNWQAYLAKFFYNKAANWVRDVRARQRREVMTDLGAGEAQPPAYSDEVDLQRLESEFELSRVRRLLDAESYAFLEQVADCNGNLSAVARLRGEHRNTTRRRLQAIRARLNRPIENVSTRSGTTSEQAKPGCLAVTVREREKLVRMAQASRAPARDVIKARLILALAAGHGYARIQRELKTTAPTISRWKRRFEREGVRGLTAKHPGRKPRADIRMILETWRSASRRLHQTANPPFRELARKLGISKSTVHRILASKSSRSGC